MGLLTFSLMSVAPSLGTANAATNYTWDAGAQSSDSSALPNYGVRSVIDVINQPSMPSGTVLLTWVSDELSNSIWIQAGYQNTPGSAPNGFLQIWNLNTFSMLVNKNFPVTTGPHTFSIYLKSGTTWAVAYDTTEITTYNAGSSVSSSSYPVESIVEMQAPVVFSFNTIDFPTAMQVQKSAGGSWSNVNTATAYGNQYGTQGQLQNPSLPSDYIRVGSGIITTPSGVALWKTGSSTITPPVVSITDPASYSWNSGGINVAVSASGTATISNVKLYLDNNLVGTDNTFPYGFSLDTTTQSNAQHTLKAIATDSNTNQASTSITVNFDNTPPSISVPSSMVVQATSAIGAVVTYNVTASDSDGVISVVPNCVPASGSTFPIGTTLVMCTVQDAAGNSATASFTVTVLNSSPSVSITNPLNGTTVSGTTIASITASSPAGISNIKLYVDGTFKTSSASVQASFSLDTGTMVNGIHTLTAVATDTINNQASTQIVVNIQNSITQNNPPSTPPTITVPSNVVAQATSASGAKVSYSTSAVDAFNNSVLTICAPASGSIFPIGTTKVNCSATDSSGNTASASFDVNVADTLSPSVIITSPTSSAPVAGGTVTITVLATDNTGIRSVAIYIDGKMKVTDSTAPYTYNWNTNGAKHGTHTITATAIDLYNNQSTVSIQVQK